MEKQKSAHKQKLVLGALALTAAAGVIIGTGYAFFSDVIKGTGEAKAGTLDISGTITLKQNTEEIDGAITNFNPGDIITVNASSIANGGTKSAWIRSVFDFSTLDAELTDLIYVCTGLDTTTDFAATQEDLIAASFATGGFAASDYVTGETPACKAVTATDITNETMFGALTTYTPASNVIDGSAEDDGGATIDGETFETTWTPSALPLIYFDAAATNTAQGADIAFNAMIQALQYRNNTTSPTEAQWETVVTSAFGS